MKSQALFALILLSWGAMFAAPLPRDARAIPPSVAKVWPVGMQRGTTASFTVDGRNFAEVKAIIFDSPGITAKVTQLSDAEEEKSVLPPGLVETRAPVPRGKKQTATVEVTVAETVGPGLHWFRIRTALGTSNLMPFDIGFLPEVYANDKAGGRADTAPEATTLPATLVGTIAVPGQADRYQFDGRAGEELVFRVTASPLGSKLESLLVLRNDSGQVLAESGQHENHADAVLTCRLPQAGKYTLSVTDREEGGGADHYYRVDAGPLPYITQVFPLGVRAGEPATVSVAGLNLGDAHEVKVEPPKSTDGWMTVPLQVKSGGDWSLNSVKLAVGNDPEVVEQEPNNSPVQAQAVSFPVTVNGHISGRAKNGGTADEDYFRFHARKGESITIDVAAARLGSPLDSVIEVLDTQGNSIPRATIRCLHETFISIFDQGSTAPAIRVTSTTGFHARDYVMVGDELDQFIEIPDQQMEEVKLRSADGLRWALLETSPEVHPLNSPVYRVEILPPGAEFPSNGLPVYHLTWRNDDGGPGYGSDSRLDFVAPQQGDYILHLEDVRGMEGPNFAYRLSLRDSNRDYKLAAEPKNPNVPKGGSMFVTVSASRVQGYNGPIEISVDGLPAGVKASPATIPVGEDSTVLLLSADASAPADNLRAAFKIVGHAKINGRDLARVANEEEPLNLASVIPPPDVVVTAEPSRLTLEPGQDVKVTLHVERRNGFQGRVPCTVQNLPSGVRVVNLGLSGVVVTETQSTRTFTLHAEDWAKPTTQPIYVVGEVESNSPTLHPSAPLLVDIAGNKETASVTEAKEANGHHGGSSALSPNR